MKNYNIMNAYGGRDFSFRLVFFFESYYTLKHENITGRFKNRKF